MRETMEQNFIERCKELDLPDYSEKAWKLYLCGWQDAGRFLRDVDEDVNQMKLNRDGG